MKAFNEYFIIFDILLVFIIITLTIANADIRCILMKKKIEKLRQQAMESKYCNSYQYYDENSGSCKEIPGGGIQGNKFVTPNCTREKFLAISKDDKLYLLFKPNYSIFAKCPDGEHFFEELQKCMKISDCNTETTTAATETSITTTTDDNFSKESKQTTSFIAETPVTLITYMMSRSTLSEITTSKNLNDESSLTSTYISDTTDFTVTESTHVETTTIVDSTMKAQSTEIFSTEIPSSTEYLPQISIMNVDDTTTEKSSSNDTELTSTTVFDSKLLSNETTTSVTNTESILEVSTPQADIENDTIIEDLESHTSARSSSSESSITEITNNFDGSTHLNESSTESTLPKESTIEPISGFSDFSTTQLEESSTPSFPSSINTATENTMNTSEILITELLNSSTSSISLTTEAHTSEITNNFETTTKIVSDSSTSLNQSPTDNITDSTLFFSITELSTDNTNNDSEIMTTQMSTSSPTSSKIVSTDETTSGTENTITPSSEFTINKVTNDIETTMTSPIELSASSTKLSGESSTEAITNIPDVTSTQFSELRTSLSSTYIHRYETTKEFDAITTQSQETNTLVVGEMANIPEVMPNDLLKPNISSSSSTEPNTEFTTTLIPESTLQSFGTFDIPVSEETTINVKNTSKQSSEITTLSSLTTGQSTETDAMAEETAHSLKATTELLSTFSISTHDGSTDNPKIATTPFTDPPELSNELITKGTTDNSEASSTQTFESTVIPHSPTGLITDVITGETDTITTQLTSSTSKDKDNTIDSKTTSSEMSESISSLQPSSTEPTSITAEDAATNISTSSNIQTVDNIANSSDMTTSVSTFANNETSTSSTTMFSEKQTTFTSTISTFTSSQNECVQQCIKQCTELPYNPV